MRVWSIKVFTEMTLFGCLKSICSNNYSSRYSLEFDINNINNNNNNNGTLLSINTTSAIIPGSHGYGRKVPIARRFYGAT
ncbi:hypothetical protein DFA_10100 [Cavenderia fasciculata]|uniref:Uncharacterized protein n=1 Tax=Cavenderia fasciculata TaxID=261658 RepID=F4Q997_CACFS|nr:uncharacterized protein DFA_10100 [Cavenderia fasciculata]EGG15266.1 hypothetical protein DFA_10100 [Cavenderia fasciculata]|eukprot:XP_004351986.1 hypothetical protein DFA_10100 [Cavenderia fasciculata]